MFVLRHLIFFHWIGRLFLRYNDIFFDYISELLKIFLYRLLELQPLTSLSWCNFLFNFDELAIIEISYINSTGYFEYIFANNESFLLPAEIFRIFVESQVPINILLGGKFALLNYIFFQKISKFILLFVFYIRILRKCENSLS